MPASMRLILIGLVSLTVAFGAVPRTPACAPAPPPGIPVVNADQTVIIVWDPVSHMEHFIRQASFKSDADDFGFLVPTPSKPTLSESGNDAFRHLSRLTAPEIIKVPRPSTGMGFGCSAEPKFSKIEGAIGASSGQVAVLDEKRVAGFHAVVLEASSSDALVHWLKEHGYAYSPQIQAWAEPYVQGGWKITAFKVAKDSTKRDQKAVAASVLRISFQTDQPLFPYREPDPSTQAAALGAKRRLLRIYFLSDARYGGELTKEAAWTGKPAWSGTIEKTAARFLFDKLKLSGADHVTDWWLTEFEDDWPYRSAPADLYFARSADQSKLKRPPVKQYVSAPWPTERYSQKVCSS